MRVGHMAHEETIIIIKKNLLRLFFSKRNEKGKYWHCVIQWKC